MNIAVRGAATAAEVDVEQLVLGLLFEGAETAWLVLDRIEPSDFIEPLHERIALAVRRLLNAGREPTLATVTAAMSTDKGLNEVGGDEYLRLVMDKGRNAAIAAELCEAFLDQSRRRAIASELETTIVKLRDNGRSASDVLADHQAAVHALTEGKTRPDDPVSWYDIGDRVLNRLAEPQVRPQLLPYGLCELDEKLGGMGDGDLIIVAGRPGMGKTALAICTGCSVSRPAQQIQLDLNDRPERPAYGVFMSSLEMKQDSLLERGLSMRAYSKGARIPYKSIRMNRVSELDQDTLARVLTEDSALPFVIDERRGQTVAQIGVRMRRAQVIMQRQGIRLGLGIIDHLGLIAPDGDYRGNKVAEITKATGDLKMLAGALGIPLMVLCQLSRKVEDRDDKRPYLADLRDSGSIEQDADQVLLLYRAEYYLKKQLALPGTGDEKDLKKRVQLEAQLERAKGKLEILADKNRHGDEAHVTVSCNLAYNWIGDAA